MPALYRSLACYIGYPGLCTLHQFITTMSSARSRSIQDHTLPHLHPTPPQTLDSLAAAKALASPPAPAPAPADTSAASSPAQARAPVRQAAKPAALAISPLPTPGFDAASPGPAPSNASRSQRVRYAGNTPWAGAAAAAAAASQFSSSPVSVQSQQQHPHTPQESKQAEPASLQGMEDIMEWARATVAAATPAPAPAVEDDAGGSPSTTSLTVQRSTGGSQLAGSSRAYTVSDAKASAARDEAGAGGSAGRMNDPGARAILAGDDEALVAYMEARGLQAHQGAQPSLQASRLQQMQRDLSVLSNKRAELNRARSVRFAPGPATPARSSGWAPAAPPTPGTWGAGAGYGAPPASPSPWAYSAPRQATPGPVGARSQFGAPRSLPAQPASSSFEQPEFEIVGSEIPGNPPIPRSEYIQLTRAKLSAMPPLKRPFFKYLREGVIVMKVCRWRAPQPRLVWLDVDVPDDPVVRWQSGTVRDRLGAKRLPVISVTELAKGVASAKVKKRGSLEMQGVYVSLICQLENGQSSLDLQFSNESERNWFFARFNAMLHAYAKVLGMFRSHEIGGGEINLEMEKELDKMVLEETQ